MLAAAERRLVPRWLTAEQVHAAAWGPHLHRWGSAFPAGPFLDPADSFLPSAHVAFCGDYIEGPHAGSVEGAVLSGLRTAQHLSTALLRPSSSL